MNFSAIAEAILHASLFTVAVLLSVAAFALVLVLWLPAKIYEAAADFLDAMADTVMR